MTLRLIRNAITYRVELPAAEQLAEHLAEMPFTEIPENMLSSRGFVPTGATSELVTPIAGGLAFTMKFAEKILPPNAVSSAQHAEIKREEAERSAESGEPVEIIGDERKAIEERVLGELIARALHTSVSTTCFYHIESCRLIVPVTNKRLATIIVGALVQACGSLETRTIHVSDVKGRLTTRLCNYFNEDMQNAFEGFKLGDSVLMKGSTGKASFDLNNLDHARQGVTEALGHGMVAERLELTRGDAVSFRLTHNFHLRRIEFLQELSDEQAEEREDWDFAALWRHEAGVQLALVIDVVQALCDLLGYQEPEKVEALSEEGTGIEGEIDQPDDLLQRAVEFVRETRRGSISAIQRKFKIGYNRAARLMDELEQQGIVTPMDSNGGREVIA